MIGRHSICDRPGHSRRTPKQTHCNIIGLQHYGVQPSIPQRESIPRMVMAWTGFRGSKTYLRSAHPRFALGKPCLPQAGFLLKRARGVALGLAVVRSIGAPAHEGFASLPPFLLCREAFGKQSRPTFPPDQTMGWIMQASILCDLPAICPEFSNRDAVRLILSDGL